MTQTRKSLELQLEDTRTQMEVEARQRANADKIRRQSENELEDLREQIGILLIQHLIINDELIISG